MKNLDFSTLKKMRRVKTLGLPFLPDDDWLELAFEPGWWAGGGG